MSVEIKGIITRILSYPSDNEPTVFKVKIPDAEQEQRCLYKGFFPIKTNDVICAKGEINNNTLIISEKPLVVVPASSEALKSSFVKALKGTKFGPKTAEKLLEEFTQRYGTTQNIIQRLNEWALGTYKNEKDGRKDSADFIETLNKMQTNKLLEWWYKNYNKRRLFLLGLNNKEITNSKMSENELYECITQRNALGVSSISLEKAIEINKLLDKDITSSDLIAARVNRFVNQNCNNRNMMATPLSLVLDMFPESKNIISYIQKNYNLIFEDELVYTKNSYDIEEFLALKIKSLIVRNNDYILRFGDMPHLVNPIQVDENITLTSEQYEALEGALSYHISVITGGAGCGKTTLIKQLVKNLNYRKKDFLLTSFTGKAVLRIKEALDDDSNNCFTLSRLIYKKKNYQHIPKFKYLIIDEASMVSSELIYTFMKFFTHNYSIILIGDCNQLPPIGLGAFFSEVIKSEKVPIFKLTENKRIKAGGNGISNILINANRLINEERNLEEPFQFRTSSGFEILEGNIKKCNAILNALNKKNIPKEKITVLTPFNKDIPIINNYAQIIFSEHTGCNFNGITYQIGDRVMQTANVYNEDFEVMNGEEGYIIDMTEEYLKVEFNPSKIIDYKWKIAEIIINEDEQVGEKEFIVSDLKHSFCKSVHKSQGSEYDYVLLYVPRYLSGNSFININLLYTAITRTKKKIWMVGDLETIQRGCSKKLEVNYQKLCLKLRT